MAKRRSPFLTGEVKPRKSLYNIGDVVSLDNFCRTLSSLKARLIAFWRESREIKKAGWGNILQRSKIGMPGEGPLFESDSNKRRGPKMRPQFELSLDMAPTRRP